MKPILFVGHPEKRRFDLCAPGVGGGDGRAVFRCNRNPDLCLRVNSASYFVQCLGKEAEIGNYSPKQWIEWRGCSII